MAFFKHALLTIVFLSSLGIGAVAETAVKITGLDLRRNESGIPTLHIRFPTMAGMRYELLETDDFTEWRITDKSLVGDGAERELLVPNPIPSSFVKVRAVLHESITSTLTEIEYPIHIYVPQSYESSDHTYPVIYATDGQWITQGFSEAIKAKGKEVILVTIEQGPNDRRATDYLLPGATDYYQFLITELLPAVESLYRIDPEQRTLCGTSYGGLLTGLVLLMDNVDTPYFQTYLSFDGSFWTHRGATAALERDRFEASPNMNVTLYLTSALGVSNNDFWVTSFENTLKAREYPGLKIFRKSYNVEHNEVAQPSFEEALDTLFD